MSERYAPESRASQRWPVTSCLVILAVLVVAREAAHGQERVTTASTMARSLFIQGKHLMNDKEFARACAAFARSHDLDRKISTLANLADCREANDELATAARLFDDLAAQLGKAKEASAVALRKVAVQRAEKLRTRVSTLRIVVASGQPEGLEVAVNGAVLQTQDLGRTISVDGGWWNVMARAPGHRAWAVSFPMRIHGDKREVRVPILEVGSGAMGAAHLPLGLDREAFERTMKSAAAQLEVCGAGFPGTLVRIKVSVSPLGLVRELTFQEDLDAWLAKCLSDRLNSTIFAMTLQGGSHVYSRRF